MDTVTSSPDQECILLEKESSTPDVIDPSTTSIRFYMLFLACMLCIGSYFVYDNPAALETQIKTVSFT